MNGGDLVLVVLSHSSSSHQGWMKWVASKHVLINNMMKHVAWLVTLTDWTWRIQRGWLDSRTPLTPGLFSLLWKACIILKDPTRHLSTLCFQWGFVFAKMNIFKTGISSDLIQMFEWNIFFLPCPDALMRMTVQKLETWGLFLSWLKILDPLRTNISRVFDSDVNRSMKPRDMTNKGKLIQSLFSPDLIVVSLATK